MRIAILANVGRWALLKLPIYFREMSESYMLYAQLDLSADGPINHCYPASQ